jgi:DNA polymerase III epsilon subunit-like protein
MAMNLSRGYAVLDLETSSLDPYSGEIIGIGILKNVNNSITIHDQIIRTVKPIPEFITGLTGITNNDSRVRGVPIHDAIGVLIGIVDNLPIVGHNVIRFDRGFLINNSPSEVLGLTEFPLDRFIDTAGLFKGMRMGMVRGDNEEHWQYVNRVLEIRRPGLKYSLGVCCRYFGIEYDEEQAHSAAYDVKVTNELFCKLQTVVVL